MFRRADNKFFAAVAEGTTLLSAITVAEGEVVTSANLNVGAVVITDLGLVRLSEASLVALGDNDQFIIVQGKGPTSPLLKSEVLTKGRINITKHKFVAAIQQATAIGFNGTTNSLPSANDTSYYIKIRKNDNDAGNRSQPFSLFGQYKTSSAADQEELAFGLSANLILNLADEAVPYIDVNVLCDEAGVVATGTTTVFGVTYGSTTVAIDGTLTLPVVGDLIRFVVGLDVPVYKVLAYTASGSIILDRAYTGATNAAVAIAGVRVVANATAIAAEFGITLTGIASPFDVVSFRNYFVNRFTASFSDDSTTITPLVGANGGVGVWQKVAMDEYMTYGYEGMNGMIGTPPTPRDSTVITGAKYGAIEISWTEGMNTLVTSHSATGSVLVYCGLNAANILPDTTIAGKAADVLGAIAVPTFASTDLNE
tara:strand:- start:1427 stop:2701 length:1275 start_codon:yes stop_codon:yes gene_type:complete